MNLARYLSFLIIMLIYNIKMVLPAYHGGLPSCGEFVNDIIRIRNFTPEEMDVLVVGKATQQHTSVEGGRCSLFNYKENCGSIYIHGNFFGRNTATVEIMGYQEDGNLGELYGFTVQHRLNSNFHIYDFTPDYKRISWLDGNGDLHTELESLLQTPAAIRERLKFTIALITVNQTNITTVMGFRFCRTFTHADDFFMNNGFVAYDDGFTLASQSAHSVSDTDIDHMLQIVVELAKDKNGEPLLPSLSNVRRNVMLKAP